MGRSRPFLILKCISLAVLAVSIIAKAAEAGQSRSWIENPALCVTCAGWSLC
jgi:hypothetical protein